MGKWISEDPIGFRAGDANLARYVENNAPNLTDPSGLFPFGPDAPDGGGGDPLDPALPPEPISPGQRGKNVPSSALAYFFRHYFGPATRDRIISDLEQPTPMHVMLPGVSTLVNAGNYGVWQKSDMQCHQLAGTSGSEPCVSVIVFETSADGRIFVFHFGAEDLPGATLARLRLEPGSKVYVFGGTEESIALSDLSVIVEHCQLRGFSVYYVPYNQLFIDRSGNIVIGHRGERVDGK